MKIDNIAVESFAEDEYTEPSYPEIVGVNGESLLVHGENRTGKTLTFNAILYNFLGHTETIGLSPGRGNRVEVGFTNGNTFRRGVPQAEYERNGSEFTTGQAKEKLRDDLGDSEVIKQFFLHSHIEKLPLENLSRDDRIRLIRTVTSHEQEQLLERHAAALERLRDWLEEAEADLRNLEADQERVAEQVEEIQRQRDNQEKVVSMAQSGRLAEIRDTLQQHEDLDQRLQAKFKRREGVRQELDRIKNQRDHAESFNKEINELIAEAVENFVCPACESHVSKEEAERRLGRDYCPFCRQKRSINDLKRELQAKKDSNEGVAEELTEEIEELEEQKADLEEEIRQLKDSQPELAELDADGRRRLEAHDFDVDAVRQEAQEELQNSSDELESLTERLNELESSVESKRSKVESLEAAATEAEERVESLRDSMYDDEIAEFQQAWTDTLRALSTEIGQEVGITEDGEILLPGSDDNRSYDNEGLLSDAERLLVNLSFATSLARFGTDPGTDEDAVTALETIVLDEPFTHLDSNSTEDVLEYLLGDDLQYVITSSSDEVRYRFDDQTTLPLVRGHIQTELSDF